VLKTRSRGDVRRGDDLSHLHLSKNKLKKLDLKLRMPLKWQLNPKLGKSLKDTVLKMEILMSHARTITLEDQNAPMLTPLTPLKLGCHPQHDAEVLTLNVYAFLENR